jgi:hypothetical protein
MFMITFPLYQRRHQDVWLTASVAGIRVEDPKIYGARRHPIANEVSTLWDWLPATITSRHDATPTGKNLTSLEDGYFVLRQPDGNEVWEGFQPRLSRLESRSHRQKEEGS